MSGLPFQTEANTGFGILFKAYLDVAIYHHEQVPITAKNANTDEVKAAKAGAMEFIESAFESVKNPRTEVERGFRFWDTASRLFVLGPRL